MLHLLLGKDWTANRDELLRRLSRDVREEKGGRILMVPELVSHETERRLCAAAGDTASRFAEVLPFTRLARRVAEDMGCAADECLDAGGRMVAMAAAARQLHSRLKVYASVETRPEFLSGLIDAVDEFKRCCISSNDLAAAAEQAEGSLSEKLSELALMLEAYDALCAQGKRDPREQMTWLLSELEAGDFAEKHVFYIDGFPDFTRQHLAILEYLIRVSPEVTVSINADALSSPLMAFEKAGETAAEIWRCARRVGVKAEITVVPDRACALNVLREKLYQGSITPGCMHGALTVSHAQSPYQACMAAAERVMDLVHGGCRYRDITVVCADLPAYRPLLELTFHRCGIPLYLSGTEDILQKNVIGTVLSALDAALGGFEQRAMLRYLRAVLSPLDPDTCDCVENYVIIWGIRGAKWEQKWTGHPDGLSGVWDDEAQAALSRLNKARELAVAPLTHLQAGFHGAENLAGQVRTLYAFLEEICLAERLDALAREMDAAGDNRSAQILNQLWEILLGAIEQLYDVLGQTVWDTEAFTRLLQLLLSQYDVGTIPPVLDAVQAGAVSAMRCHQQKHLILLGAQEGSLPSYGGAAGILTDLERVALRKLGVPLTGGAMEGIQAQFAEIYGVFCGATESVSIFYCGEPSFVCRRLRDLAGGEETVHLGPGAAQTDRFEAAAYLAGCGDEAAAAALGLRDDYDAVRRRRAYTLGTVARAHIDELYGKTLHVSASQVDRQAECRLSYFLKYGLRAKERKEATVDPAEFGTFVHAVLENTGRRVKELGGFRAVSQEQTLKIAEQSAQAYADEHFAELDSQRVAYLFHRNVQELQMVVQELWEELQTSEFQPEDFEVGFGVADSLPPIALQGKTMNGLLRGFVDRVDTWQQGETTYYRVVDYKTGKKDFDYCDVFSGVGLQMLLYLFTLQVSGEGLLGPHPVPAGVQYFPARVPYLSADGELTEEELEKERSRERKRKGLLLRDEAVLQAMESGGCPTRLCCTVKKDGTLAGDLADREQLKMLKAYILRILGRMVDEIASGEVAPNPYTRGTSHNACTFCPYDAVCHKETVAGRRSYKAMSADKFWDEIEKEMKSDG